MEALCAAREVVPVIGQNRLLQGWVLPGGLRRQVLARLLGWSGEERRYDMGPLLLWPALPLGGPLEDLQECLDVVLWAELGEPAGRGGDRAFRTACCVIRSTASRSRARLSAVSRCCSAARACCCRWAGAAAVAEVVVPSGFCMSDWVGTLPGFCSGVFGCPHPPPYVVTRSLEGRVPGTNQTGYRV